MITFLQDPGIITPDWLQFGALGLLALVLIGVGVGAFIIIRDTARVIVARVAETGRFAEKLATDALARTQDIAEQSVATQIKLAEAINQSTTAIQVSTKIIEQLQAAILETGARHTAEHREIQQNVARLDGSLGTTRRKTRADS